MFVFKGFASSGPLLVSDQPYAAEHDLRPAGPSALSSGEDENFSYYTDVNNHTLWESSDVDKPNKNEEEEFTEVKDVFGEMRVSDSDEEKNLKESEENLNVERTGSGHEEQGFSERPETEAELEGREDEQQREDDSLQLEHIGPSEVGLEAELEPSEPPASEGGIKTEGCEERMFSVMETKNVSSLMDEEKTWYFTWI